MIFSPGNNKEEDVSFTKVFQSDVSDPGAYSDAGSMDTECHQNPTFPFVDDHRIVGNQHRGGGLFREIPREVVRYMMENFIDDETLLRNIMPLSREYEDYSLDLIYRRNIGKGDSLLSFIYNYKAIAQAKPPSSESSEYEALLFSSEMFDKLFENSVLKVIDLHDFCKHGCVIVIPLLVQYSRQCEEFAKLCKKARKKIVSPTSLVEGTVFPTSPVENPDVFLLGEQHFNIKRQRPSVLSPRSILLPPESVGDLDKKQVLLHKRYFQIINLFNLVLSVDYLKTWQWCLMNDLSMFRRISSKNSEKIAKIPKSVKRSEEEAFLFCRELFYSTKEIKKLKNLPNYKKIV